MSQDELEVAEYSAWLDEVEAAQDARETQEEEDRRAALYAASAHGYGEEVCA